MAVELKIPAVGESITEVQIGEWLKAEGDTVQADEAVVMIETDKVTVELPAPASGTITKIILKEGDTASVGDLVGYMEEGEVQAAAPKATPKASAASVAPPKPTSSAPTSGGHVMPAAARAMHTEGVAPGSVAGSGPGGRVLKEDVMKAAHAPVAAAPAQGYREEKVVPMTPLRKRIAERLVEAQTNAALLTTFNEVDMTQVMGLRKQFQEQFTGRYDIKLGFMSFFVKACVDALKQFPAVNAEVRENSIVYRNYADIGVAVGGGKGLVVPVIRDAERLSFAGVEKTIKDFGVRAKKNAIKLDELSGGTFTITNGGIYGSLLSTPIVNPPQSGILGLHGIQQRPVALDGQVVIRPMMYIALTYDHRVVDGREAVSFLVRIKQVIEDPARMLIEA